MNQRLVLFLQLQGFGYALAMLTVLFCASLCFGKFWGRGLFFVFLVTASLLTWLSITKIPFLPIFLLVALLAMAVYGTIMSVKALHFKWGGVNFVCFLVFVIDLLHAALPLYRYDQWNYHLIIPRIISLADTLPREIYFDHIYFTGLYEYFFILPRIFISDPVVMQAFTNRFSLGLIFSLLYACINEIKLQSRWFSSLPAFPIALFLLFALDLNEVIANAKPDFFLYPLGLLFLACFDFAERKDFFNSFLLAFLFVVGLALKVNWIHFIVTLVLVLPFLRLRLKIHPSGLMWGMLFGLAVYLPVFAKNIFFFSNPIHPVQSFLFRSSRWSDTMETYWHNIALPARSVMEYFFHLAKVVISAPVRTLFFFLPLVLVVLLRKDRPTNFRKNLLPFFSLFIVYCLLWPFFYEHNIDSRFVSPLFSIAAFGSLIALDKLACKRLLLYFTIFVPILLGGNLELKAKRIFKNASLTLEEFYLGFPAHLRHFLLCQPINAHRSHNFPTVALNEKIVLSDMPISYFFDSLALAVNTYDFDWLRNQKGKTESLLDFFSRYDIAYIFDADGDFSHWPKDIQELLPRLKKLDEGHSYALEKRIF